MPSLDQQHSSGLPSLNDHLGGLQAGDNVVWVSDRERFHRVIETAFLTADTSVPRSLVLLDGQDIDVPEGVTLVDARPGERLADVVELEPRIVELGREPGARIVVRGLDTLTRRLGDERTLRFFTRTCPRLFDQGAIAYWRASRAGSGRVLDAVQRVTQCVFEFAGGRLHVRKSEGRPGLRGRIFDAELSDDSLELDPMPAAGRLAEGLRRIRNERALTQTEIARLAGVSPSAISQAEAGHRGLGVETLLTLSEALGVSMDDFFDIDSDPGYVLARRDRIPPRRGIVSLLDDPGAGLRAHLITLGPGESGGPPAVHKGAELVMVSTGLVQLILNEATPVMRAGDALLVTRDAISGWHNLLPEPARLFWIVRD